MSYLEIKNRPYRSIRVGIGIIMVLIAVTWVILFFGDDKVWDLVIAVVFMITGVYHMTNGFGIERSWIRAENNILTIKWMDKIRIRRIPSSRIESICLGRFSVLINLRDEKPHRLKLGYMGSKEKTEIYDFMAAFCRDHNIHFFRNEDPQQ